VRFHPLLENHRYAQPLFHVEPVTGSVSWRLEGDLFAGMHAHHRRAVRKAKRDGPKVRVERPPQRLDGFAALYEQTMRRQAASPFYFFPDEYWRGLAGREWLALFEARAGDETVAAILCLATPPWLHYHLGASADAARGTGASHLLMLAAAEWAQERSYEQFHLGAGVGGSGGRLLEWKRRFYPSELREQWIGKAVHDNARYRALTGGPIDYNGFFPAYRRR
jgi:serine/alanine adding enzyme